MQTNPEDFAASPEQTSNSAQPNSANGTPQYGEFGRPTATTGATQPTNSTTPDNSVTQGGEVAPPVAFPEQRGSVPQNLDTAEVRNVADSEYFEQREGWAKDDPRYGGGTRNWATNEPANHSTGPAPDTDEEGHNPNVGNNDNPDEFSAFRPDEGRGIPGASK